MGIEAELPNDWTAQTIEECMAAIIDYRGKTPQKVSFGVPLITAKIVKGGRILPPEEFIAEADYEAWMRRGMPKPGDVVVTTEAPLGEVAQLDDRKIALAQRLIGLRGKPDRLDNTFLRFAMQSAIVQDQLAARSSGTTVHGIRQAELRHVEIPLPPLPEQRAIARVLGGLDDKIELNRRMNRTLEDLARGLFRSWFVDFDPVTRNGTAPPKAPASIGSAAPHSLFSKRLVDSPLGPIPEGWRVGTVGDIGSNPRRGVLPSEVDSTTAYIGLEHMPRRCITLDDWGTAADVSSGKSRFSRGEILFGKLRPYFHKVGVALIDGVCSTDVIVAAPKKECWFGVMLGHLSSEEFIDYVDGASGGTRMPRTSWGDMARYQIAIPPEPVAASFAMWMRRVADLMREHAHESRTLAATRDALLPQLLSGEIRLREAERVLEGAAR
jgi:type I restriction enzyme, S subunit